MSTATTEPKVRSVTRCLSIKIQASQDPDLLRRLWQHHVQFNQATALTRKVVYSCHLREGMSPDDLKPHTCLQVDTPEKRRLLADYVWGMLQCAATFVWDPLYKSTGGKVISDESARKQIGSTRKQAAERLLSDGLSPEEVVSLQAILTRCDNYVAAFDAFQAGWYPFRGLITGLKLDQGFQKAAVAEAFQMMRGYLALHAEWRAQKAAWKKALEEWKAKPEHAAYLLVQAELFRFEREFERKKGGWWQQLTRFFAANPELAAWNGGEAVVLELTEKVQDKIEAIPDGRERALAYRDAWLKRNPQLKKLWTIHQTFKDKYVPKTDRHDADGFDHPPTFTENHWLLHPRYFVFPGPQTGKKKFGWRNLSWTVHRKTVTGTVELCLIGENGAGEWVSVPIALDRRFRHIKAISAEDGEPKYVFDDKRCGMKRPVSLGGMKLVLKRVKTGPAQSFEGADFYLTVTLKEEATPWQKAAEDLKVVRSPGSKPRLDIPLGLKTGAVVLTVDGALAISAEHDSEGARILREETLSLAKGLALSHIQGHLEMARAKLDQSGGRTSGEPHCKNLRRHRLKMLDERAKRLARRIVDFAHSEGIEVLLFPGDERFLGKQDEERFGNLTAYLAQHTAVSEKLKQMCAREGIRLWTAPTFGIWNVCAETGAFGLCHGEPDEKGKLPVGFGQPYFTAANPDGSFRVPSEANAARNLLQAFSSPDWMTPYAEDRKIPKAERAERDQELREAVAARLAT